MTKCPRCQKELDHLTSTVVIKKTTTLWENGTKDYTGHESNPIYACPICYYVIAKNDTSALLFLENEEEE